jgi:RNA polymerase sigma-70 factor (ECF subfamily)
MTPGRYDVGLTDDPLVVSPNAETALGRLYEEFHRPLLAYLRACDHHACDDLAGDTWLKVAAGLSRFDGDKSGFRAWLFTIARCRVIDHRRTMARRADAVDPAALAARAATDDPAAEAVSALDGEAALRTIGALPPDQADVVLLRVVADLSTDEVATIMGKRPGTVRVLQHRALRRLAKVLDDDV